MMTTGMLAIWSLSFGLWYMYAMFGWVRLEYGLQYGLLVVWNTGKDWLK